MQYNSPINELKDQDGPFPWAEPVEPLTAEQIARATDAVNFVLVAATVPFEHRMLIDALIGASLGSMDWFECADIVIAQRARNAKKLEVKEKSTEKWTQRERDALTEWQTARGITLIESMPGGWKEGVRYKTRYRLGNLFRLAIATDRRARLRPGFERNPKRELRKAAEAVYSEFRAEDQEPAKRNRFRRGRRTCDTYLKIINGALEKLAGQALIENRDLTGLLAPILLNIQGKCELLINSLAPLPNSTQVEQTQTVSTGGMVDKFVHWENDQNSAVHTSKKEEYGQSQDEFLSETFPRELDVYGPSDFYSLEDLERYDSKAGGQHKKERRFCCPRCGDDKPQDDEHRSLSLNTYTGAYYCHRCNVAGALRENLGASRIHTHVGPRQPEQKSDKWREWWSQARLVAGTPGQKYLEGRGVPIEAATAANVRYGTWWKRGENGPEKFNAVQFPVLDADGDLVAVIARGIHGKTMRTGGEVKLGVFRATLDATDSNRIAITESPIDALILAAVGLDAVATGGTHWPEWLTGALRDKDVALAQDADKAGDECATQLSSLLPTARRLRPEGSKDWAEVAEWAGLDWVAEVVMAEVAQ